jgi:hypothetical protein
LRRKVARLNVAYYVVLMLNRPIVLFGQASPYTSAIMRDFLGNKAATNKLLSILGHDVPEHLRILDRPDLEKIEARWTRVIFKPINDSNRVAVVGPVETANCEALRACYERCLSQISNGPDQVLCERYIDGTHFRINVNHGKVTFVARSVLSEVTGDGLSSVRQLLGKKRSATKCKFTVEDRYIANLLVGQGLSFDSVIAPGRRVALSHDGNEEGYFEDVTDEFPAVHKVRALKLSEDVGCPVLGLDVIIDALGIMWIVDVNTNPGIDFFGSPRRAYETMEHMIQTIVERETLGTTSTREC